MLVTHFAGATIGVHHANIIGKSSLFKQGKLLTGELNMSFDFPPLFLCYSLVGTRFEPQGCQSKIAAAEAERVAEAVQPIDDLLRYAELSAFAGDASNFEYFFKEILTALENVEISLVEDRLTWANEIWRNGVQEGIYRARLNWQAAERRGDTQSVEHWQKEEIRLYGQEPWFFPGY